MADQLPEGFEFEPLPKGFEFEQASKHTSSLPEGFEFEPLPEGFEFESATQVPVTTRQSSVPPEPEVTGQYPVFGAPIPAQIQSDIAGITNQSQLEQAQKRLETFNQTQLMNAKKKDELRAGIYKDQSQGLLKNVNLKGRDANGNEINVESVTRQDQAKWYQNPELFGKTTPGWYFDNGRRAPDVLNEKPVFVQPSKDELNKGMASVELSQKRLKESVQSGKGSIPIWTSIPGMNLLPEIVGKVAGAGRAVVGVAKDTYLGYSPESLGLDDTYKKEEFNAARHAVVDGQNVLVRIGDAAIRKEDGPEGPGWYIKEPNGKLTKTKTYLLPSDTMEYRKKTAESRQKAIQQETRNLLQAQPGELPGAIGELAFQAKSGVKRAGLGLVSQFGSMLQSKNITEWAETKAQPYRNLDELAAQAYADQGNTFAELMSRYGAESGVNLASNTALMAASGSLGGLTTTALKAAGTSEQIALKVGQIIASVPESASEAFSTQKEVYDNLISSGYSDEEAKRIALAAYSKSFALNMGMLAGSNVLNLGTGSKIQNRLIRKTLDAINQDAKKLSAKAVVAKTVQGAIPEILQEGIQYGIGSSLSKQPETDIVSTAANILPETVSPEGIKEMALATPMMLLTGGLESVSRTRQAGQQTPEQMLGAQSMPETEAVEQPAVTPTLGMANIDENQRQFQTKEYNKQHVLKLQEDKDKAQKKLNKVNTLKDNLAKQFESGEISKDQLKTRWNLLDKKYNTKQLESDVSNIEAQIKDMSNLPGVAPIALPVEATSTSAVDMQQPESASAMPETEAVEQPAVPWYQRESSALSDRERYQELSDAQQTLQFSPEDQASIQKIIPKGFDLNEAQLVLGDVVRMDDAHAIPFIAKTLNIDNDQATQLNAILQKSPEFKTAVDYDKELNDIMRRERETATDEHIQTVKQWVTEIVGKKEAELLDKVGVLKILPKKPDGPASGTWAPTSKTASILITPSRSIKEVANTIYHEVGVHAGLQKFLGEQGWQSLKEAITYGYERGDKDVVNLWNRMAAGYSQIQVKGAIGDMYRQFKGLTPRLALGSNRDFSDLAFEEFMGSIASAMKTADHGALKKLKNLIIDKIRQWLLDHGWEKSEVTKEKLQAILEGSLRVYLQRANKVNRMSMFDADRINDWRNHFMEVSTDQLARDVNISKAEASDFLNKPIDSGLPKLPPVKQMFSKVAINSAPRPVLEVLSSKMASLSEFIDKFTQKINQITRENVDAAKLLSDMARKNDGSDQILGMLLGNGTVYKNADGTEGRTWTEQEIRHFFPNVSQDTISAYFTIRREMDRNTKRLIDSFTVNSQQIANKLKQIYSGQQLESKLKDNDENLAKIINKLSNKAYWPLARWGKFKTTIYEVDEQGNPVTYKDEGGKQVPKPIAVIMHNHKGVKGDAEINARIPELMLQRAEFKKAWEEKRLTSNTEAMVRNPEIFSSGVSSLDVALGGYIASAAKIDAALAKQIETELLSAKMADNMRKHMIHRSGVAGWETSALKTFNQFVHTVSTAVANNEDSLPMMEKLREFDQDRTGPENYDEGLRNEALGLVNHAQNPPSHTLANRILQIGFMKHMGLSPAFAIMNKLQIAQTVIPTMANFYGIKDAAGAAIIGEYFADRLVKFNRLRDTFENLSPQDIKNKLDGTIDVPVVNAFVGNIEQAKQITETIKSVLYHAIIHGSLKTEASLGVEPGKAGEWLDRAAKTMGVFATKTEQSNRLNALIMYTILSMTRGELLFSDKDGWYLGQKMQGGPKTVIQAERLNALSNFVRGRGAQPAYLRQRGWPGGLLSTMFNYKSFAISSMYLFHALGVANARKESSAAMKAWKYAKPQLVNLTISSLLGGPTAYVWFSLLKTFLPDPWIEALFEDALAWIKSKFTKAAKFALGTDDKESSRLATRAMFNLQHGLIPNATVGIDMHNNLNANMITETDDKWEQISKTFMGATLGDITGNLVKLSQGKYSEAAKGFSPRFYTPVMDAVRGWTQVGTKRLSLKPKEALYRGTGFQPTEISRIKSLRQEVYDFFFDKQKVLLDEIKRDIKQSAADNNGIPDSQVINKAALKIERFNLKHRNDFQKFAMKPIPPKQVSKILRGVHFDEKNLRWIIGASESTSKVEE